MNHSLRIQDRLATASISPAIPDEIQNQVFAAINEGKNFEQICLGGPLEPAQMSSLLLRLTAAGAIAPVTETPSTGEILLVTDSSADLPASVIKDNNIVVIPLTVAIGGRSYRDGVDISPREFYSQLREVKTFPSTSPPTVEAFQELFEANIAHKDILGIFISRKMSKTFDIARQAIRSKYNSFLRQRRQSSAPDRPLRIELIDSGQVSMGVALLVLEAAEKIRLGWDMDRLKAHIENLSKEVQVYFMVDKLDYLARGGRIGRGRALLGSFLGFKPILGMSDGGVNAKAKAFGGKRAQQKLLAYMEEELGLVRQSIRIGVCHADAEDRARGIKEQIGQMFPRQEIVFSDFGPTVGAHTGPGAIGVAWLVSNQETGG